MEILVSRYLIFDAYLAALSNGVCKLKGVLFSDDSRAFISCLVELGFEVIVQEDIRVVSIRGLGGKIPNRNAKIIVRSGRDLSKIFN